MQRQKSVGSPRVEAARSAAGAVVPSSVVVWLAASIVALSLIASAVGLFWERGDGPFTFTTLRGETAQILGSGLYRYDSLFAGAGNRGTDALTLVLGIPLLVVTTLLYRRGSARGALLFVGTLAYFLYVYTSMALNAAYNELFLVYVALFSTGLYGFVLAFTSIDLQALPSHFTTRLPRRGPALFMFASGLVTLVVWLGPLLAALTQGQPPARLDGYSTRVTDALDLAIITPATFVSGALILRRVALGYLVALSLLVLEAMLAPMIALQTAFQLSAGVSFPPGQIAGPIAGFATLGVLAVWITSAVLRGISDRAPGQSARR